MPPQRFLTHSTSAQLRRRVELLGGPGARATPCRRRPSTWPTMLPKLRRLVPSMPRHQRGLVIRLRRLASVGFGGADRPFLMSLWRWPRICRSSVSTSALHLAALARSIRRSDEVAVPHHVGLEPERRLGVRGDVLDRADAHHAESVNGMPNFSAARAARISPSACCMPVRPVGAIATGIAPVDADHRRRQRAVLHVDGDALAQLDALEVGSRWRGRCSRSTSRNRRSRRTCAARAAWRARAGLRCW